MLGEYNIDKLPKKIRKHLVIKDGHWIWTGGVTGLNRPDPKGRVRYAGRMMYPHRVIFYIFTGFDLLSPLQVNHKRECLESLCCYPGHLYSGNQNQNMQDMIAVGHNSQLNKTNCPNCGMVYNTSPTTGRRYCAWCKNKRRDEWKKRQ